MSLPPENAYFKTLIALERPCVDIRSATLYAGDITFCLISSAVSVRKMDDVGSLELILDCGPCRAGKKVEWTRAGLWKPNRGAASLVILK